MFLSRNPLHVKGVGWVGECGAPSLGLEVRELFLMWTLIVTLGKSQISLCLRFPALTSD